ncbi:alpha/beta fold hydrolase [Micromonospora sp. NBC_01813]|uniref:alpha/beta fold hydrolase n=1 Tax=Micromonospora sp. NBC_01813 TaxID=2975988 RepID=UPI002DD7FD41|nr:alpha/beta hydrolase [Micromonospora sp. NBC_01813]WSA06517.1 alpha/beta hydrolase [Micromonospora sp. NBC_01813]
MTSIQVGDATISYDEIGDGPPVLLIHAGIADRRMWRAQLAALRDRHRLIAMDLRGYGESDLPAAPFAHHDDVVGLLDALGIARAALVGCSFGGAVALDVALAHPDRVTALALFGSALGGHDWSDDAERHWDELVGQVDRADLDAMADAEVRFWVVGPHRQPADVDPGLLALAREMDRRALAAEAALGDITQHELDPPAARRLGEIGVPVLVGAGALDIGDIPALADLLAAGIPLARRLPDVPGAAHLLPLERPDEVNAALRDFLAAQTP